MKILQQYILKELWLPFVVSFFTLNFIFMAGYLVKAANFIIGRGIPITDTIYVLILALPEMVSYTAPTSILTAVLLVFGGLSQNNEIRAVKASGINPVHIMMPAFLASLVFSFFMFVFNDQVATHAGFHLRKTTKKMIIKHPAALIEPGRFVKLSDSIVFLAKKLKGNEMFDIVAYENEGTNKPIRTIIAERGEIVKEPSGHEITIRLYDGSVSDAEDASVQSIQFSTYEFPTFGKEDIRLMRPKTRDLTLAQLLIKAKTNMNTKDERRVWSAFHQRIAFSFGCFIFAFIGVPTAILVHRGEIIISFGISMALTSIYYILFVGAKTLSLQGVLPAMLSYWLPNLLIIGFGIHFFRRSLVT